MICCTVEQSGSASRAYQPGDLLSSAICFRFQLAIDSTYCRRSEQDPVKIHYSHVLLARIFGGYLSICYAFLFRLRPCEYEQNTHYATRQIRGFRGRINPRCAVGHQESMPRTVRKHAITTPKGIRQPQEMHMSHPWTCSTTYIGIRIDRRLPGFASDQDAVSCACKW